LFVDSRYLVQAEGQGDELLDVVPTGLDARRTWISSHLKGGEAIGIDLSLHSASNCRQWHDVLGELGAAICVVEQNPVDLLWADRPPPESRQVVDYQLACAGLAHEAKLDAIRSHIIDTGAEALLVADPEDISWLLNVRAFVPGEADVLDFHVVPSCPSQVLILASGDVRWFVPEHIRLPSEIAARAEISGEHEIVGCLETCAKRGPTAADLGRTPARFAAVIEAHGRLLDDDIVARNRWSKHPAEVRAARTAHIMDAAAIVAFLHWVTTVAEREGLTEASAAQAVDRFRRMNPAYLGPAAPVMLASGPNGAIPHYIPHPGTARRLFESPLFWLDSGGQYVGGTTDNTVTIAIGRPEPKHVRAHTVVLKSFIALASARFPEGSSGLRLDAIARSPMWAEGMDFAHNVGHGVGNCLNVHEGPFIGRNPSRLTDTALGPGMIVSNEPGYYVPRDFGLRIESHLAVLQGRDNFLEFETISRLPIDARLVDWALLSSAERSWLQRYHGQVLNDVMPLLAPEGGEWLEKFIRPFLP
jgi:Xaa-Pro aminopeptidase